jgi:hypothetical protein
METYVAEEYDHFISFVCNKADGKRIVLQYKADQVWKDGTGVWQIRDGQEPFYVFIDRQKQEEIKLSPAIIGAFENVTRDLHLDECRSEK